MRRTAALLTSTALLMTFVAPATAASKPYIGGPCKLVHQIDWIKGVRAQCTWIPANTKNGRKLVWRALAPAKSTTPATELGQKADTPTVKLPTTLEELRTDAERLAEFSWSRAMATRSTARSAAVNLVVGPHTQLNYANPQTIFDRVAALFSNAAQAPRVDFLVFSYADRDWVTEYYRSIKAPNEVQTFIVNQHLNFQCPRVDRCNGGGLEADSHGHVIVTMASDESAKTQPDQLNGGTLAHEFTHTFQEAIFAGQGTTAQQRVPAWLFEGMATWAQHATSTSTLEDYKSARVGRIKWGDFNPATLESDLLAILDRTSQFPEHGGYGGETYAAGMLATEALVTWKGIDAPLEIIRNLATGLDFPTAFQTATGEQWTNARTMLAQIMATSAARAITGE